MRSTLAVVLLCALAAACQDPAQQTQMSETAVSAAAEIYLPPGDPTAGKEVFLEFRCNTCHSVPSAGIERRVEGELGPELGKEIANRPREEVATSIIAPSHAFAEDGEKWKSGDLSRMGDFSEHLTVRQWMDLVSYLRSIE